MSDEIRKYQLTARGKSVQDIDFLIAELEGRLPGRYFVYTRLNPANGGIYDFGVIFFIKITELLIDPVTNELNLPETGIMVKNGGQFGVLMEFFLKPEDWIKIEPDFITLKTILNFEGGPEPEDSKSLDILSDEDFEARLNTVDDRANARKIIRLWRQGKSRSEIANKCQRAPGTMTRRIYELRKQYGENLVPYRR